MQLFSQNSFVFWYDFLFLFIFCTSAGALLQCWFLINFCGIKSKKRYYVMNLLIAYAIYLFAIFSSFAPSPMLDTFLGAGILFVFLNRFLKQNYIRSTIVAALAMAILTLSESILFLLQYFTFQFTTISQTTSTTICSLLFLLLSFAMSKFFIERYSVNSRYQSNYFLGFALPIFFISVVLRMVNSIRYAITTERIFLQSDKIQTYEMLLLTIIAFLCICVTLYSYEQTLRQLESENQKNILHTQIGAQENYILESKRKYEATKTFRHDFKNHLLALRGLLDNGDLEKVTAYMERFEQTYQSMTFSITTGNSVVDILLGEKLSYAQQLGISVQCDVTISAAVKIDDFDLCAIFANVVDNAIKACHGLEAQAKSIDIVAKPNKNFFVIDVINPYREGNFPKGHGIGLTTVQIVAEKYHGAVERDARDNVFRISVILPFKPQ